MDVANKFNINKYDKVVLHNRKRAKEWVVTKKVVMEEVEAYKDPM